VDRKSANIKNNNSSSNRIQGAASKKVAAKREGATSTINSRRRASTGSIIVRVLLRFMVNIIKWGFIFAIILGFAGAGILGGAMLGWIKTAPHITADYFIVDRHNSFVYDAQGNQISELKSGESNLVWADYEDMPEYLSKAFIAIEDKRFEYHNGVDFRPTIKAYFQYGLSIVGLSERGRGASTITQQLIKLVTGNLTNRALRIKVQEQWLALQLEREMTKAQIMEQYLNKIPMGGIFYGVQSAAKGYYGKDVSELSLAECASIAGITNMPEAYKPTNEKRIEANLKRQKIVLEEMRIQELITQDEYEQALLEEVHFKYNENFGKDEVKKSEQSYFTDQVIEEVKRDLMKKNGISAATAIEMIYNKGLKIYTTMNPNIQAIVDEVYTNDEYFPVVNKNTQEHPQSAITVINPENGYVQAIYGGYGIKQGSVYNRATQMKRSPGSTIKPIAVYAPGIEMHTITPATVVDDIPLRLNPSKPNEIFPKNYTSINYGLTPVREGLYDSRNVVATLILKDYVGIDSALEYMKKVGIDRTADRSEMGLALAMGGIPNGMSPLEMASAYTVFANKGNYSAPIFYTRVETMEGKVLLENKPLTQMVYSEEAAYLMNDMMQDVVKIGTASGFGKIANSKGEVIPTAGKTGTTSNWYDKWFVGFSPYYVASVWYGYDEYGIKLAPAEYNNALKIWNTVMAKIHADLSVKAFYEKRPSNIVTRTICTESGKLATDLCSEDPRQTVKEEIFIKGTEPDYSEICDVHYKQDLCTESKDAIGRFQEPSGNCPSETVKQWVRIRRPVPYEPIKTSNGYLLPEDWGYEIGEGTCSTHLEAPEESEVPPETDNTTKPDRDIENQSQGDIGAETEETETQELETEVTEEEVNSATEGNNDNTGDIGTNNDN